MKTSETFDTYSRLFILNFYLLYYVVKMKLVKFDSFSRVQHAPIKLNLKRDETIIVVFFSMYFCCNRTEQTRIESKIKSVCTLCSSFLLFFAIHSL